MHSPSITVVHNEDKHVVDQSCSSKLNVSRYKEGMLQRSVIIGHYFVSHCELLPMVGRHAGGHAYDNYTMITLLASEHVHTLDCTL